jgi:hypothetical protein
MSRVKVIVQWVVVVTGFVPLTTTAPLAASAVS